MHRRAYQNRNIKVIKRSNKVVQALILPKIMNINPRSAMNKLEELQTFISESHDRENMRLDENIKLEDHEVISNIYQREGKGGRPALIVNKKKYSVQNLTNTLIQIPWGVEVTWALLTPKNVSNDSIIQNIVLASIYSKPKSKKKNCSVGPCCRNIQFPQYKIWKRSVLDAGW